MYYGHEFLAVPGPVGIFDCILNDEERDFSVFLIVFGVCFSYVVSYVILVRCKLLVRFALFLRV